jgi:hypothetical protein
LLLVELCTPWWLLLLGVLGFALWKGVLGKMVHSEYLVDPASRTVQSYDWVGPGDEVRSEERWDLCRFEDIEEVRLDEGLERIICLRLMNGDELEVLPPENGRGAWALVERLREEILGRGRDGE